MSNHALQEWISPEAYLLQENDRAEGARHEYVNGQIFAMVGASRRHNLASMNLGSLLHQKLRGTGCNIFLSDMKVRIKILRDERFYYPDIQASCVPEKDLYYNEHPCLIVEVLSPHTERTDRNEKFDAYRMLDSLQEYVLISQDSPYIELYRRRDDWQVQPLVSGDTLALESVDLAVPLSEIFEGVFEV